jgi:hypothetical protein
MAGTNPSGRERLGAVLLAALLALSVVAGVAGLGAAHGNTDHITRDGDALVVTLGDKHGVNETKQLNVSVAGETYPHPTKAKNSTTDTFRIPVENLSVPKQNLKNANVTVAANGTELFTESANLRYLKFGKTKNAGFRNGKLRVPLTQALGYSGGQPVALSLDGNQKPVSGTVQYEGNDSYLAVSFDAGALSLPVKKNANLAVPNRAKTSINLRAHVERATSVAALDGGTLAVSNPLFADSGQYDLAVETSGARFASAVNATNGRLTVSDAALAAANRWTVSAYRDGQPLFENVTEEARTTETIAANVTQNGSVVSLTDGSVSATRTTVWLTNATRNSSATNQSQYVSVSVPVENGDVNLSSTRYRLNPNGSYRLVVTGDQFVRAEVSGNESASDTLFYAAANAANGGSGGDGSSGTFGFLEDNRMVVAAIGILLVGLCIIAYWELDFSSAGSAGGSSEGHDHEVKLRAMDAERNEQTSEPVTVVAEKHGNTARADGGREEIELTDGTGSLSLGRGKWTFTAESGDVSDQKRRRTIRADERLRFELGPQTAAATVTDDDGAPLSDVSVTATFNDGESRTEQTDSNGRVTFALPLEADEVELSATQEKYDGDSATVSLGGAAPEESLTLDLRTGSLDLTVTVDGTPVSGLPVETRSREQAVREVGGHREETTDEEGVGAFTGLPVGKYEVGTEVPGDAFAVQSKRVTVRDGRRARATLDASFEYDTDPSQDERITEIRRDVDELTTGSGRDVAIPRYYGSVVTALLDTVERLPREGHRFASADADPDEVVAALLDTAEETVELVDDAMATKRNTDLFGACVDMRDERVSWDGDFEVETLFGLLGEDRTAQRQTVRTQLQAVDDRINDERSDVAVVAPARELWEGVKQLVRDAPDDDAVRSATVVLAAAGLLDAIDELFDHDELRERLERTVF